LDEVIAMTHSASESVSLGEAAADGLLAGAAAGIVMAGYLIVSGLAQGDAVATTLARFGAEGGALPTTGAISHLAVSGVYGLVFGIGRRLIAALLGGRVPGWLAGALFGLALYALAVGALLPASGSPLQELPALHLVVAHLLYGATLGYLTSRRHPHPVESSSRAG
jgi:hypothetical protein